MLNTRFICVGIILITSSFASAAEVIDFESALSYGEALNNINDIGTFGALDVSTPRYIEFGRDVRFDSGDFWLASNGAETTLILTGYNDDYTAGSEVYMLVYDINDTPTTYVGNTQAIDRLYIYSFNTTDLRLDNIVYSVPAPGSLLLACIGTCIASWIRKRRMA